MGKPAVEATKKESKKAGPSEEEAAVDKKIREQGDQVRKLKGDKADKAAIDAAVKELLALKAEYKALAGKDWKPSAEAPKNVKSEKEPSKEEVDIDKKIKEQGDKVRQLKGDKADKAAVDEAVKALLALKAEYKSVAGKDWKPSGEPAKDSKG